MAKSKSSAAKKRQRGIKTLLKESGPMTLQTLCWWKLNSIPPNLLPNHVQIFTNGTTGEQFLAESSALSQSDLAYLPFSKKPDRRTITRVYKQAESNRLTRLPPEILRLIYDSIDPMEGGGGGILAQFALCKAVFPLLERYWDSRGPESLQYVLRSVMCSLDPLPTIYTKHTSDLHPQPNDWRESHSSWVLEGNPLPNMLRYYSELRGLQLPRYGEERWVEQLKNQAEKMLAYHVKEAHGGYSPELILSCLFGTANSPPCNLEAHYQSVVRQGTSKYIVININVVPGLQFLPNGTCSVYNNERILLSVRELCRIQRLLGLASFMTETGQGLMRQLTAFDGDWGNWKPVDEFWGDVFEAADAIIEKLQDAYIRTGGWQIRWIP
ncbi:hypothetical protein HYFRA_00004288 [Hymenoscyphus fraxineus]|uniref:Uncharacterized protein n=1 Tax=Hymenoscyphus fraxineus TaxID=746836 RepID=A0A9N9PKJ1_9HELO|nr:hypothetical protein HYFRA_00004288 [Hymenoscyphus fraxineus]